MNVPLQTFIIECGLRSLRAGDVTEQSRQVFAYAARHLRKGEPLPEPLAEFLATAFDKIAKGEDPIGALSLKRKRGRKEAADHFELAKKAFDLIEGGMKPGRAFAAVAEGYPQGIEPKTVKRAYDDWSEGIRITYATDRES